MLSISSAGGIFGKGAGMTIIELHGSPDHIRQIGVPFYLQNNGIIADGNRDTVRA